MEWFCCTIVLTDLYGWVVGEEGEWWRIVCIARLVVDLFGVLERTCDCARR